MTTSTATVIAAKMSRKITSLSASACFCLIMAGVYRAAKMGQRGAGYSPGMYETTPSQGLLALA